MNRYLIPLHGLPRGHRKQTALSDANNSREFKFQRRGRQRERKKTIGYISKTTALHVHHTFFVHFFPVFARLRRENA